MVKHIVLWKLRETDPAEKASIMRHMKELLEGLVDVVPGLVEAEVGLNYNPDGYDVSLYATLTSREALDGYQIHPAHVKVKEYVQSVACGRAVSDYEI